MSPPRTAILLAVMLVFSAHITTAARVPVASSVRLFVPLGQYKWVCDQVLTKAQQRTGTRAINFLPTQYYVDSNKDFTPDSYCFVGGSIWNPSCDAANGKNIKRFQQVMTYCFKKAYNLGFRVFEITPRLDELYQRTWRNEMRINCDRGYGGITYRQMMIAPLVRAINSLPARSISVYFNIQGEMNGPLITFPKQWRGLAIATKKVLKARRKAIGINLNFNKMCSWCTGSNFAPNAYNYQEKFDNWAIQRLFGAMNFIAMSAYAPLWVGGDTGAYVTPARIENSAWIAAGELKAFGVDLMALNKRGRIIHYSEYGLGGGTCGLGNCPAWNSGDVAKSPYFGIFGAYNPNMDPWKNQDSKNFRYEFYKQTIRYASGYGRYSWKIGGIFIWAHGSFDVQGLYPDSTNAQGSWADWGVIDMIKKWNKYGQVP